MATRLPKPPALPLHSTLRYDLVSRRVGELAPTTVLEIGCGEGGFGTRLAARYQYLGVEPDETTFRIAAARIRAAGGTILNVDHTGVPAGSTYDLVCAFEVLEHIEDDKAMVIEWAQYVRPGGHIMISVPAWQHHFGQWDERAGHFRRYSPEQISGLLLDAGLTSPTVTLYGWPVAGALQVMRNRAAVSREHETAHLSYEERTASSGRLLHPKKLIGSVARVGIIPFCHLQRLRPDRGMGLIAVATMPTESHPSM